MSTLRKMILQGTQDSGAVVDVPVTREGHVEVALHAPRLPFGAVHTERLNAMFQSDAVYGLNAQQVIQSTGRAIAGAGSGTVTGTNNLFKCSTGTTSYSYATIQSRRRLRYRPGQGVIVRYTALFSSPVASSILVAGCGTAESGFYFGYNGTSFGILHVTGGVREIQTLTVTTGSSTDENITITLGGVAHSIAVTNSGSTTKTAYEIAQGTYTGWKAQQRGATVVFLANDAGNKTGTFSLSGATTAVGTFAETLAGVLSTDTWIPQSSWNGDKLDGTGPSGITLDPSKGNVYQIDIQYLGFGAVVFKVEAGPSGNNPDFVVAHTINVPNSRTSTTVSQPSFPFTMAAYSAGSTTDVSVSAASFAGFIEGERNEIGPRSSFRRETNGFVGSTASTYYPLFTIRNDYTHNVNGSHRANQSVTRLLSLSCSHDDATPIEFILIREATLVGTPAFSQFHASSHMYWDTAATTCTYSTNDQVIFSFNQGQNSGGAFHFNEDITIQPGESVTLAARAVTGIATYVLGSLNTREDV